MLSRVVKASWVRRFVRLVFSFVRVRQGWHSSQTGLAFWSDKVGILVRQGWHSGQTGLSF